MDSDDEDMFAISDDDVIFSTNTISPNPVEEHLLKQLTNVQSKIDTVTKDIARTKQITARILNTLEQRAFHGEDVSSDSDSEYTIEGVPIIKKKSCRNSSNREKLKIVSQWQCILQDKWIIGVELHNGSCCTLYKPRYYPYVRDKVEIFGVSMFWELKGIHWERIKLIRRDAVRVVATVVLDLPKFERESFAECWGTISYEINETQLQIPVTSIRLTINETVDSSFLKFLNENKHGAVLALKGTSGIEKIVNVQFMKNDQGDQYRSSQEHFLRFLITKSFAKVYDNVFLMKEHGTLIYCLIEIQSIDVGEANIKIFARSVNQLNIVLHLLRGEFSDVTLTIETDDCIEAAVALIRELEMIRDKKDSGEIEMAKIITDLLIS